MDLNKQTLAQMAGVSASTLTKMVKGEHVNLDVLIKICNALNCEVHDILELVSDGIGKQPDSESQPQKN
jgi:DNA-binding Xre family transcriptional regulator